MQMSEQPGKSRVQFEHPHDDRCGPRVGRPGAKRNLGQMGGGGGTKGICRSGSQSSCITPAWAYYQQQIASSFRWEIRVITMTPGCR